MMRALFLVPLLLAAPGREPGKPPARPQLVAHRGLLYHAPEDTLAAYAAAIELRLGFELDVQRTRDGKLIVMHDDDVRRTTDGQGKVAERTLAEIKKLDAGAWFDPAYAGERVPTLDEVFALYKQRRATVPIFVDLKAEGIEADVVRAAVKHGLVDRIVCIGRAVGDAAVRRRLRAANPRTPVAALATTAKDLRAALAEPDADWVLVRFVPTAEEVAGAHRAGRRVLLAGAQVQSYDPDVCRRALDIGVDALLTDFPLECRALWRSTQPRPAARR